MKTIWRMFFLTCLDLESVKKQKQVARCWKARQVDLRGFEISLG